MVSLVPIPQQLCGPHAPGHVRGHAGTKIEPRYTTGRWETEMAGRWFELKTEKKKGNLQPPTWTGAAGARASSDAPTGTAKCFVPPSVCALHPTPLPPQGHFLPFWTQPTPWAELGGGSGGEAGAAHGGSSPSPSANAWPKQRWFLLICLGGLEGGGEAIKQHIPVPCPHPSCLDRCAPALGESLCPRFSGHPPDAVNPPLQAPEAAFPSASCCPPPSPLLPSSLLFMGSLTRCHLALLLGAMGGRGDARV